MLTYPVSSLLLGVGDGLARHGGEAEDSSAGSLGALGAALGRTASLSLRRGVAFGATSLLLFIGNVAHAVGAVQTDTA